MNIIEIKLLKKKINNSEEFNTSVLKEEFNTLNRKSFYEYISLSKILASYGVIVLHLNGFWNFNFSEHKDWLTKNIYETLFYYSVPIFVLCIGSTLLDFNKKYNLLEYNKRRAIKVFEPLIGWNIILYFYKAYVLKNISTISFTFTSVWNYFFASKLYSIYNSLHIFLLTYMLIPLLAHVEKPNKIRIYTYYFFVLLITQSIIPYFISLFGNKIIWIYKLNIGYLIYIFAGYVIHNNNFSKLNKITIYILGVFSFFIHLIGTKILTIRYKKIIAIHKGYLNLPCIIYSCALFLFIKEYYYFITKVINKKYINKIGSLTLGPFFLHFPVMETISKFPRLSKVIFSFNLLLKSFLIFLLCIIFSYILKKIPLLKKLIP